jgi:post-segregation antitoxin (ccd killing protein)
MYYRRTEMSVITIRVPKKVKEKLKKYNVNISETVRKVLDKCLEELEQKDLKEKLEQAKCIGNKIDPESIAKLIREDREAH